MTLQLPRWQEPVFDGGNQGFSRNWVRWLRDLVTIKLLGGQFIESVSLTPFTDNNISHDLGRDAEGAIIVRDQGVECNFAAYLGSNQTALTTSSSTPIVFNTEERDRGSNFDTSTGYFTAPVAGLYAIDGSVQLDALTDTRVFISLEKNSAEVYRPVDETMNGLVETPSFSTTIEAAAGDVFRITIWHNKGTSDVTANAGAAFSRFSGRLIRETWDDQDNNSTPESTLTLRTTYAHTVSLWVF